MSVNLKGNPFFLNEEQISRVENTYETMAFDEQIGQLFCCSIQQFDTETIRQVTEQNFGSMMIRPFPVQGLPENIRCLQDMSKYPMLISGNLENGGIGVVNEGTLFSQPMGCTATGNMENG